MLKLDIYISLSWPTQLTALVIQKGQQIFVLNLTQTSYPRVSKITRGPCHSHHSIPICMPSIFSLSLSLSLFSFVTLSLQKCRPFPFSFALSLFLCFSLLFYGIFGLKAPSNCQVLHSHGMEPKERIALCVYAASSTNHSINTLIITTTPQFTIKKTHFKTTKVAD